MKVEFREPDIRGRSAGALSPVYAADPFATRLALAAGATAELADGRVVVCSSFERHAVACTSHHVQAPIREHRPIPERATIERVLDDDGPDALVAFHLDTAWLLRRRLLQIELAGPGGDPIAVLVPISDGFRDRAGEIGPDDAVRLSRFALLRRGDGQGLVLESPLCHARILVDSAAVAACLHAFAAGASPRAAADQAGCELALAAGVAALAWRAAVLDRVVDGRTPEDADPVLRQWDHHDLYFHARSRLGRNDAPVGGRYRFLGQLPPRPAVKDPPWPVTHVLDRPDLAKIAASEPGFGTVLEARRSVRFLAGPVLSLGELAEFLYRVARVRSRHDQGDKGELTSRPYPSGGASYELELYLDVDQCRGLAPGFYWYDPALHALRLVRPPDADTRAMLVDAHRATAGLAWPQVLFVVAARFQRVSWKYDAMAYATILKNTGALYTTMYLVATAMGLSPCGLGLGDADRFSRVAGTGYAEESSVGEFILCGGGGRPAAGPA